MKLTEDIDPQGRVNLLDLDTQQRTAVHRIALALDDTNEPNVATATLLAEILRTFLATHFSIRFLLSKGTDRPEIGSDAVSLAREQIEKVFLISLLVREWEKYLPIYFEDDWCRNYRYFLIQKKERENLERSREFFSQEGPEYFESRRQYLKITGAVRDLIEFQVNKPEVPLPKILQGIKIPKMPLPGAIMDLCKGPEKPALLRWHEEYKVVCGYTHLGADKLQLTTMTGRKLSSPDENIRIFFKKEIVEKAMLSYIACAYSSAELLCLTGGSLAAMAEVTKFWNVLLEASLVAKIFWNIRSKQLLPLATL